MAILLKMHEGKWRIKIVEEEWEFSNLSELLKVNETICKLKDKNGRINKVKNNGK